MHFERNTIWTFVCLLAAFTLSACDNMREGNRLKPYETTPFFEDGSTARQPVEGTVPVGFLRTDAHLYQGLDATGQMAKEFPFPITREVLERGQDRYNIYCMVCHGVTGIGDGMIVRRGYKVPPSFHDERLKQSPPGYFFTVMTNGFGVMSNYNTELTPEDRWAVAAYIQALQKMDVPAAEPGTKTA
jgi:cytochrome c553